VTFGPELEGCSDGGLRKSMHGMVTEAHGQFKLSIRCRKVSDTPPIRRRPGSQ
jgi:hypothetical protein